MIKRRPPPYGTIKAPPPPPEPESLPPQRNQVYSDDYYQPTGIKAPAIFDTIPELATLARQISTDGLSTWARQYPGELNGQPREQKNRHLYNPLIKQDCPYCQEVVGTYLDYGRLTAGPHCPECNGHQHKPEVITNSYLQYELERKPSKVIRSDYEKYIADDPMLSDKALWDSGGIFHLDAPMGAGKTTLIYNRTRESYEAGDNVKTLIVVPRVSLAKSILSDLNEDVGMRYGINHKGSGKDRVGEYGAVSTMGRMAGVIETMIDGYKEENIKDGKIRIFIDEVDFAFSLRLAGIFKRMSPEIKRAIQDRKDSIGIVTAGQTACPLALEAIAKEIGGNLICYSQSDKPSVNNADMFIVSPYQEGYTGKDGVDRIATKPASHILTQSVINKVIEVLKSGKKCYVFGDQRRTAQVIASYFGDIAILYDAYHKRHDDIDNLHRLQRLPDDKSLLITTTAVDVGVSIHDDNAETVVFSTQNPAHRGLASTVQQCLRNRHEDKETKKKPPLTVYLMEYNNALPLAPTESISYQHNHANKKLSTDENISRDKPSGLISQLGIASAMNSLVADQTNDFMTHHLRRAGYGVKTSEVDGEHVDITWVKAERKAIKDNERAAVIAMADSLLSRRVVMTDAEIRELEWGNLQPAPIKQLAYERANDLLQATGWDGERESVHKDVTDAIWDAAKQANNAELSPEKIASWLKGYLVTHYPDTAFDIYQSSTRYESHHRSDILTIGHLVKSIFETVGKQALTKVDLGQALIDAAQKPFGHDRLSALMRDGSLSPSIAKRVRFIDLGIAAKVDKDDNRHLAFVSEFISEYYPARVVSVDDGMCQIVFSDNIKQVVALGAIVDCLVGDETPIADHLRPVGDPNLKRKMQVIQMSKQGMSLREIAKQTDVPRETVRRWVKAADSSKSSVPPSHIRTYVGLSGTPHLDTESSTNPHGHCIQADNSQSPVFVRPDKGPDKRNLILQLLESGEKTTSEIVAGVGGSRSWILTELKKLVDAGDVVKIKRGVYGLPSFETETERP